MRRLRRLRNTVSFACIKDRAAPCPRQIAQVRQRNLHRPRPRVNGPSHPLGAWQSWQSTARTVAPDKAVELDRAILREVAIDQPLSWHVSNTGAAGSGLFQLAEVLLHKPLFQAATSPRDGALHSIVKFERSV